MSTYVDKWTNSSIYMSVAAHWVSFQKASVSTVSSDSYKQATLCIFEFNKDHTAANILSKPKDQINVWLPSKSPSPGIIITDNRARVAKAARWQIYTCAMFLYIVYICCYTSLSGTLVSIFWQKICNILLILMHSERPIIFLSKCKQNTHTHAAIQLMDKFITETPVQRDFCCFLIQY